MSQVIENVGGCFGGREAGLIGRSEDTVCMGPQPEQRVEELNRPESEFLIAALAEAEQCLAALSTRAQMTLSLEKSLAVGDQPKSMTPKPRVVTENPMRPSCRRSRTLMGD